MKIEGMKINFLGDSITEGVGASETSKRYTDVMQRKYGIIANNYGISGTRFARQSVVTDDPFDQDYCMRVSTMDETADAVIVFGGTNDYGHGDAPLGTPDDRTPATFYGACHYLFNELLNRYSGKPILILTPLHRLNENNPRGDRKPEDVAPLSTYRKIIMEVAEIYSLKVLDLYKDAGIQPNNEINRNMLAPDGLHPSDIGHELLADRIATALINY